MMAQRTQAVIDDLRQLPAESAWVEFKENNHDAQMIGKLIWALSNAARLADQPFACVRACAMASGGDRHRQRVPINSSAQWPHSDSHP